MQHFLTFIWFSCGHVGFWGTSPGVIVVYNFLLHTDILSRSKPFLAIWLTVVPFFLLDFQLGPSALMHVSGASSHHYCTPTTCVYYVYTPQVYTTVEGKKVREQRRCGISMQPPPPIIRSKSCPPPPARPHKGKICLCSHLSIEINRI